MWYNNINKYRCQELATSSGGKQFYKKFSHVVSMLLLFYFKIEVNITLEVLPMIIESLLIMVTVSGNDIY